MGFTAAERKRIIEETKRITEELKDFKPRPPPEYVGESARDKWVREAEEAEERKHEWKREMRRREAATARRWQMESDRQQANADESWNRWLRTALDGEREVVLDYVRQLLTEVIAGMREETAEQIKQALAEAQEGRKEKVVDLPAFPLSRRRA
jgi:hypothetical protein